MRLAGSWGRFAGLALGAGLLAACRAAPARSSRAATATARDGAGGAQLPGGPGSPPSRSGSGAESGGHAGIPVHGEVAFDYRLRTGEGESDHDLGTLAVLDVGDPAVQRVTAHAMARIDAALDGRGAPDDVFFELDDTWDSDLHGNVYYAYVDVHRLERWSLLRVGRQELLETPEWVLFDGARVETVERGGHELRFGAYAGVPVYPYESSRSGDALVGAYGELRPWEDAHLRLDWMHLEDENRFGGHEDDVFAAGFTQRLARGLLVEAEHSRLEGRARDLRLGARWFDAGADASASLGYYRLLEPLEDHSVPVDPFFYTLQTLFPYHDLRAHASKGLGPRLRLDAGLDVRRVDDEDDAGTYNRDFERAFLTAVSPELLPGRTTLTLTGEVWDSDRSDLRTLGFDLSREFGARTRAALGTSYALYKYEPALGEERDHVRVWYLDLRRRSARSSRFTLRVEYEDAEQGDFFTLRLGRTWQF